MPGLPEKERNPSPMKKSGSARTSKKSKRKNLIRFSEWSEEQESLNSSSTGVKEQAQDVDDGNGAIPKSAAEAEAISLTASDISPGTLASLDHQTRDTSPNSCATAAGSLSPPIAQLKDAPPLDSGLSTTSEQTAEHHELRQGEVEKKADDCPSENMRPNAQNLRYGGYPAQPAPQHRNTPLGSGRLQNTSKLGVSRHFKYCAVRRKADALSLLGNGTNWGFGAPANGAPGLPSVQPSQTGTGTSSFAQRVGGSQPAAPLDLS